MKSEYSKKLSQTKKNMVFLNRDSDLKCASKLKKLNEQKKYELKKKEEDKLKLAEQVYTLKNEIKQIKLQSDILKQQMSQQKMNKNCDFKLLNQKKYFNQIKSHSNKLHEQKVKELISKLHVFEEIELKKLENSKKPPLINLS